MPTGWQIKKNFPSRAGRRREKIWFPFTHALLSALMAVQNLIVKVQKRNRALVRFDPARIWQAIFRAAESIGGFHRDFLPGINDPIFATHKTEESIATFLADAAIVCLNSNPHHLISNFPPTIETMQDEVLHALRSYGFQHTADAYECYRWGRHWLREGAITKEQFVGNGFPHARMWQTLEINRQLGVDTVAGLNETVRSGRLKSVIDASLAAYEASLDAAAEKDLATGDLVRAAIIATGRSERLRIEHIGLTQAP